MEVIRKDHWFQNVDFFSVPELSIPLHDIEQFTFSTQSAPWLLLGKTSILYLTHMVTLRTRLRVMIMLWKEIGLERLLKQWSIANDFGGWPCFESDMIIDHSHENVVKGQTNLFYLVGCNLSWEIFPFPPGNESLPLSSQSIYAYICIAHITVSCTYFLTLKKRRLALSKQSKGLKQEKNARENWVRRF